MGYPPGDEPLPFDSARVSAAADACLRAAAALRTATAERHARAVTARARWLGRYRDQFDAELTHLEAEATALEDQLRRVAGTLTDALHAAWAENQRRAQRREEWDRLHPARHVVAGRAVAA
jgi:hypothetical protein